ncbi:neogenin-like protein [Dinothrombium tinctorium]|uniref:Neogenin-like protein n=1 Tax=Dinothrombium tinctorium TaxID=1965070 RepID=A0A3S5WGX4_9ACAR|nr:neogenin-like protein [Dinothrombium tinctorium]
MEKENSLFILTLACLDSSATNDELTAKIPENLLYEPPQNITLETASSSSIIVRWEPPQAKELQNNAITEYKIRYRIKGHGNRETITTDGNRRLYALNNLKNGVQYQIRVAAVYGNMTSPFSDWYTAETFMVDLDETQPPEEPSSLQAKAIGNHITLNWTPPLNQKIMLRGYTIGWGVGFPDRYTKVLDSKKHSFVIENVEPSSEYIISLRAYNAKGEGKPIYESVKTPIATTAEPHSPLTPPLGLKAIVHSSSIIAVYWTDTTLSRNEPASDNRRYIVRYTSNIKDHPHNPRYNYCNTTQLKCVIEDLRPNTQYEFAVKVIKGRRTSEWSMSVRNTTFEAAPSSAPRDLTVVGPSENEPGVVHIHWQPPKYPNGQITGYILLYTADNTLSDTEWMFEAIGGDRMTHTLKKLTHDTKYYFKIQARNSKGFSPMSKEVSYRTPSVVSKTSSSFFDHKGLSTQTLYLIIVSISAITVLLFIIVSTIICKATCNRGFGGLRKHKGYTAAATSPGGKSKTRDLKPPDLWIHHHDQIELKGLDKTNNADGSLTATPIPRNSQEFSGHDESKKSASGYSDGLYDDLHKGSISPTDTNMSLSGTSTTRRTARAKPIMIPVDAQSTPLQTSTAISFEPSTGLSRPVYPRTQLNVQRAHVTLDPVEGSSTQHHLYDPVASPALHMGLGTAGVVTNGHLSSNVSYSSSNPVTSPTSTNTLNKRLMGQHSMKSFSVPSPPNSQATPQPKHIAVRPQIATSPQKKTAASIASTGKAVTDRSSALTSTRITLADSLKKEDDLVSTYSTEELNQEMANLEGLMKDLSAITASQFEISN